MLRHFTILLLLTLAALFALPFLHEGSLWVLKLHNLIVHYLSFAFKGGTIGGIFKQLISVVIITIASSTLLSFLYGLIKGVRFPYWIEITWGVWITLMMILVVSH